MSLSKTLWNENEDLARAALEGSFVRGVANGALPRPAFEHYVAEDAFFLEAFAKAYALSLAHSPDKEGLSSFSSLISGVVEELELHAGYAKKWGVDLERVEPGEATLAYTDFLLSTASLESVGDTCAAMTPCMRLYAFLGKKLEERGAAKDNPYKEWIEAYSDPGFEELAATLETLLDRYAEDCLSVRSAYRRAMKLEVAFFEAAYGKGGTE
ncbi:MAG: TenA family protein [Rubrobacteraceae bacterium]|jgi:thiaminase/transcriptional activator TenA|nr:TenA family protein [Rubrobacter sp.]